MQNVFFFFILILLNNILLGQEEKIQIFLKNGSSKYFNVKEVKSWGLLNNEGFGASFAVIDSIKTSKKSLADSIILQLDGADYDKINDEYIIDISNSRRKFIPNIERSKFVPQSISVNYSINQIEQIVFKLEYNSGILNNLLFKTEGSLGFHSNKEFLFNQNFGFGFIYTIALNNNEIGMGLTMTNFNDYAKNSGDFKSLWVESLDISLGIPLIKGKYMIKLDSNIYFEKLNILDYNSFGTIRLGIGLNL